MRELHTLNSIPADEMTDLSISYRHRKSLTPRQDMVESLLQQARIDAGDDYHYDDGTAAVNLISALFWCFAAELVVGVCVVAWVVLRHKY